MAGIWCRQCSRFGYYFKTNKLLRSIVPLTTEIHFHSSPPKECKSLEVSESAVITKEKVFKTVQAKDKKTFINVINSFQSAKKLQRGHVEFIYAALKCMEEFNVQADIECYKKLMDVFPKGKMIPKNLIQAEFFYFPRHQDCAVELLDQMERNGICPDKEMKELIINVFGKSSHVFKKVGRMLYWMPKFKNLNPYKLPDPVPSDVQLLAELALKKMTVDLQTKITRYKAENLEDSIDKTWIVSAQSPVQQRLLLKHNKEKPLYVEGPYLEWLEKLNLFYFVLRADPSERSCIEVDDDDVSNLSLFMFGEPKPKEMTVAPLTVHEQEDGTIFSICATGTSSKDSVLSWIRFLQQSNPVLETIPVLFKLKSPPTALAAVNAVNSSNYESEWTAGKDVEQQS